VHEEVNLAALERVKCSSFLAGPVNAAEGFGAGSMKRRGRKKGACNNQRPLWVVSVCFGEQGLDLLHGMNVRRQDAKTRGGTDGPEPSAPAVSRLPRVVPADVDLLEGLRRGSSLPSRLKAVPRAPVQILLPSP